MSTHFSKPPHKSQIFIKISSAFFKLLHADGQKLTAKLVCTFFDIVENLPKNKLFIKHQNIISQL
jgi:hypothetical protein